MEIGETMKRRGGGVKPHLHPAQTGGAGLVPDERGDEGGKTKEGKKEKNRRQLSVSRIRIDSIGLSSSAVQNSPTPNSIDQHKPRWLTALPLPYLNTTDSVRVVEKSCC